MVHNLKQHDALPSHRPKDTSFQEYVCKRQSALVVLQQYSEASLIKTQILGGSSSDSDSGCAQVGGSTRIPKIQTLLSDFFNGKVCMFDP